MAGAEHCPPPGVEELACLQRAGASADMRLACQLRPGGDIAVVPLLEGRPRGPRGPRGRPAAELPATSAEHELAFVLLKIVGWQALPDARPSPHDQFYALNQWLDEVGNALLAAGADHWRGDSGGASACFGRSGRLADACRQACAAAERLGRELDLLNQLGARAVRARVAGRLPLRHFARCGVWRRARAGC